jgi:hypothetical protein
VLAKARTDPAGAYTDSERGFDLVRVARALRGAGRAIDVTGVVQSAIDGKGNYRNGTIAQYTAWKKPSVGQAPHIIEAAVRAAQAHPYSRSVMEPFFRSLNASEARHILELCAESSMPAPTRVLPLLEHRDEHKWMAYLRKRIQKSSNASSRVRFLRFVAAAPPTDRGARLIVARALADIIPTNRTTFRVAITHLEATLPGTLSREEQKVIKRAVGRSNQGVEGLSARARRVLERIGD